MLSDFQRQILCLALERRFITCDEILTEMWGFQCNEWGSRKASVGNAQYASAHASLSRSLTRLWRRRLIEYWKTLNRQKTGITLTAEGERLACIIMTELENEQVGG